ncbi:MAG: hypothetical protein KDC36_08850 [Thermoleophilia bacterium]|nr:hypothetical protein [Thermoleophilia bacterium]
MADVVDSAELLEAARAALAERRWQDARDTLGVVVGTAPSAEAHELLSWACWWLDEAEGVFEHRLRAYESHRDDGDNAGAARMALWLACDHLDFRGAAAVANGWLARAARLLGDGATPEHAWLAFFEGYFARMAGEHERALERGSTAAGLGRELGVADTEMLGLALQGATHVSRADVDEGLRQLDEATTLALTGEAELAIAGAWACCFLVTSCLTVRDFTRAAEWCDRIAEFAERYGSRYMLAFCRAEYGSVHLWRGRWDTAESVLSEAVAGFSASRPAFVGGPLAGLAELRRRQGRAEEAEALANRAGALAGALLCRARLALDRGDPRSAADLVDRVLRRVPADVPLARLPALEVLTGTALALGDVDRAGGASAELTAIAELVGTPSIQAAADHSAAQVAAATGEHDVARVRFEDAVDAYHRSGCRFEAERSRLALAETLAALGRDADAAREADLARGRLAELGAATPHGGGSRGVITPREREVLGLVAEGLTNPQIAERLVISEHTVHRHVANLLGKLGVPSRAAAAAKAVQVGLLDRE